MFLDLNHIHYKIVSNPQSFLSPHLLFQKIEGVLIVGEKLQVEN